MNTLPASDAEWDSLRTRTGLTLRVRREGPDDAPALVDLFRHLGPTSRFLRFGQILDHPDPERIQREAERLARLGPPLDMAWLAFADLPDQPDAPVAGVRYVRTAADRAEMAISVRDDVQRRGIGSALLLFVCDQARADGIRHLVATFRGENKGVWALLRHSPYPITRELDGPEVNVVIDLS